jgi:hypothetical protein
VAGLTAGCRVVSRLAGLPQVVVAGLVWKMAFTGFYWLCGLLKANNTVSNWMSKRKVTIGNVPKSLICIESCNNVLTIAKKAIF